MDKEEKLEKEVKELTVELREFLEGKDIHTVAHSLINVIAIKICDGDFDESRIINAIKEAVEFHDNTMEIKIKSR